MPESRSRATSAGLARPPPPKKLWVLVSKPLTGPFSATAKIESGSWSSLSGSWATDSIRRDLSYAAPPKPRFVLIDCWYGFTSQYSNHDTFFLLRVLFRSVTSCSSSGSSPNGA